MKKQMMASKAVSDTWKWEALWSAYVKAKAALDVPTKGANARMAQARLGKAEKAIRDYDYDFYCRIVVGR